VSPSLAWAVGERFAANDVNRTLIERWDGTAWTRVSSPNPGLQDDQLIGAAAPDATHAFAVGGRFALDGRSRTLVEQWDGTSWSVVPSPDRGPGTSRVA
jgi:hypothetical protein